ncbi:MAG: hypothetical protein U0840_11705 [Gemmataceae bacterium]
MGRIASLLAVEIHGGIAGLKPLASPEASSVLFFGRKLSALARLLDERAVDAEVLAALPAVIASATTVEKRPGQKMLVEPRAVLAEAGGVEGVVAGLQVQKPPEQQIGIDAFTQLPFAADRIQAPSSNALSRRSGGRSAVR